MCACGRKKNQVVTSVNAELEAAEQRRLAETLYENTLGDVITGAEQLTRSAAAAIGNTRS